MIMPHLTGLLELNVRRLSSDLRGGPRADDERMRAISMCSRLEKLNLDHNDLGDENVIHIVSSCDRLRELHLLRNRLTDAVAPALMRLRRLSTLALVGRQYSYSLPEDNRISAAALEGLRGLPGLLVLD